MQAAFHVPRKLWPLAQLCLLPTLCFNYWTWQSIVCRYKMCCSFKYFFFKNKIQWNYLKHAAKDFSLFYIGYHIIAQIGFLCSYHPISDGGEDMHLATEPDIILTAHRTLCLCLRNRKRLVHLVIVSVNMPYCAPSCFVSLHIYWASADAILFGSNHCESVGIYGKFDITFLLAWSNWRLCWSWISRV